MVEVTSAHVAGGSKGYIIFWVLYSAAAVEVVRQNGGSEGRIGLGEEVL